jgi:hypothetical protein
MGDWPREFDVAGFNGQGGWMSHHPVGTCEQLAGRGLVPRLSTGTLQLSIRCSSIHFLPSRSFPVSVFCWTVEFGVGRSSGWVFWAAADHVRHCNARQSAMIEPIDCLDVNLMEGLANH